MGRRRHATIINTQNRTLFGKDSWFYILFFLQIKGGANFKPTTSTHK